MHLPNPLLATAFVGYVGVARADITPPVGINARNWGAATHDVAEGVHRPLTATALAISATADSAPLILIAADLGWWKSRDDEGFVRGAILNEFGFDESRVLLSLSHTHAGPNLYSEDRDKPGGSLIEPYLTELRQQLVALVRNALATRTPSHLTWRYGRCDLAQNRDLPHPTEPRFVVGWNPDEPADDTLLVGRVQDLRSDRITAIIVNYACHPTTLAWENRLISPDFPGAMRELIESSIGAPGLFLQGASGDLGTAAQHGRDPVVADRLGRRLGYAVLGTLESWPDALRMFDSVVESGAPLGTTRRVVAPESSLLQACCRSVPLPLRPLEPLAAIEHALSKCQDRTQRERWWRKRATRRIVGADRISAMPLWFWRIGEALLVAQPNEPYSPFQLALRRSFAPRPVIVLNVTNGYAGYLPPRKHYDRVQYSVWQTPFAAGGLEQLIERAKEGLQSLLETKP